MSQRGVGVAVPIPSAPLEVPSQSSRLESWPPRWAVLVVGVLCLIALGMTVTIVMSRMAQAARLDHLECRVENTQQVQRQILGERSGPLHLKEC